MGQGSRDKRYVVAALTLALAFVLTVGGASASTMHRVSAKPSQVRAFWTPKRLRQAIPLDTLPSSKSPLTRGATVGERRRKTHTKVQHVSRYPNRTNGKVYFREGQNAYQCSATAVHSPSRSLVWTAGHCVYEQAALFRGYVTDWEFIPAFTPHGHKYGEWRATSLKTTTQYMNGSAVGDDGSGFDVGAATVAPLNGQTLEHVVGSRKLAFNTNPRKGKLKPFGYPATRQPPEFTGRQLFRCNSRVIRRDGSFQGPATLGVRCDMTGGASGGAWINSKGKVASVTSYGYPNEPGIFFGPYLGTVAKQLYESMSR